MCDSLILERSACHNKKYDNSRPDPIYMLTVQRGKTTSHRRIMTTHLIGGFVFPDTQHQFHDAPYPPDQSKSKNRN
jgi:hypothetical protein